MSLPPSSTWFQTQAILWPSLLGLKLGDSLSQLPLSLLVSVSSEISAFLFDSHNFLDHVCSCDWFHWKTVQWDLDSSGLDRRQWHHCLHSWASKFNWHFSCLVQSHNLQLLSCDWSPFWRAFHVHSLRWELNWDWFHWGSHHPSVDLQYSTSFFQIFALTFSL